MRCRYVVLAAWHPAAVPWPPRRIRAVPNCFPVGAMHESSDVAPPPGPDRACRGRRPDGPLLDLRQAFFMPVEAIHESPAAGLSPGRRRCEASRRRFCRRRRCKTKRSDLGWRFSFFSHSFFCKKKKEWEKEKTCPLRWISSFTRGCGRCAGPMLFLFLERKSIERKNRL